MPNALSSSLAQQFTPIDLRMLNPNALSGARARQMSHGQVYGQTTDSGQQAIAANAEAKRKIAIQDEYYRLQVEDPDRFVTLPPLNVLMAEPSMTDRALARFTGPDEAANARNAMTETLSSQFAGGGLSVAHRASQKGLGNTLAEVFDPRVPMSRVNVGLPMDEASRMGRADVDVADYAGEHKPPMFDGGAPAHDLTGGGDIYPDDVYSHGARYYGTGDDALDYGSFDIASELKGKPNAPVTIYRAVPYDKPPSKQIADIEKQMALYLKRNIVPSEWGGSKTSIGDGEGFYDWASDELARLKSLPEPTGPRIGINKGDWVTINRGYAKQHGEGVLGGKYRVVQKKVYARDIYTNGDSIHEWGYDPQPRAKKERQNALRP